VSTHVATLTRNARKRNLLLKRAKDCAVAFAFAFAFCLFAFLPFAVAVAVAVAVVFASRYPKVLTLGLSNRAQSTSSALPKAGVKAQP
jgi:uncharacterized protein (DUF2062 family)